MQILSNNQLQQVHGGSFNYEAAKKEAEVGFNIATQFIAFDILLVGAAQVTGYEALANDVVYNNPKTALFAALFATVGAAIYGGFYKTTTQT